MNTEQKNIATDQSNIEVRVLLEWRSYQEKFEQLADKALDKIPLELTIDHIEQTSPSNECLE